jgi:CheY-like chemotaxis protein
MATRLIPVLIVDDNAANLKLARFALEGEGYEVRTAPDGEAALLVLREFRPRLILMDLQLPGVDGLELTRRLKDDPATSDIIIVAVTAFAMSGDRERSRRAGCDGYLTKPIDPILLPAKVAEYLAEVAVALATKVPVGVVGVKFGE